MVDSSRSLTKFRLKPEWKIFKKYEQKEHKFSNHRLTINIRSKTVLDEEKCEIFNEYERTLYLVSRYLLKKKLLIHYSEVL